LAVHGAAALAVGFGLGPANAATTFNVTNLVSDGFVPAAVTDSSLINPWGISSGPTSPFWVADNASGVSTLYSTSGAKVPLTVTIPPPGGAVGTGSPTGTVFNGAASDFHLTAAANSGAAFLFDSEDGTISGWSPKVSMTSAILEVDNSAGGAGAVYKGLAIGSVAGQQFLYASNFRSGEVERYDSSFSLVNSFTDPNVASGYSPFNVQVLGGNLFVTYALQDAAKHDDVAGAGNGYVDEFSLSGAFEKRLVSLGGQVDSPWGLDIAPSSFGSLAGDLLVGNFGDGTISAFDATTGAFQGQLLGADGKPFEEGDLWALSTGNGGAGGDPSKVYFTAGLSDEAHGLFGSISAVPEPMIWTNLLIGVGLMGAALRRRRLALPA
jgi:uncharacterized protein (TIGR03118 family)